MQWPQFFAERFARRVVLNVKVWMNSASNFASLVSFSSDFGYQFLVSFSFASSFGKTLRLLPIVLFANSCVCVAANALMNVVCG